MNRLQKMMILCFVVVVLGSSSGLLWAQGNNALPQQTSFTLQHFRPSFDPAGVFNTFSGENLGQWNFYAGMFVNFGFRPLIVYGGQPYTKQDGSISTERNIVEWQLGGDIAGGVGLLDLKWFGLDVGFLIPFSLFISGGIPKSLNCNPTEAGCITRRLDNAALGDMELRLKLRFLSDKRHGIGLALVPILRFPSGHIESFNGEDSVTFALLAAVSKHLWKRLRLVGNVGIRYRPERSFLGLQTSSEFCYQVAVGGMIVPERFELMAELTGALPLSELKIEKAPLELLAGFRIYPLSHPSLALLVAGGAGLVPGFGIPGFRVILGLVYSPAESTHGDQDNDGVPDHQDRCPNLPGSPKNYGCPLDRDKDGIADKNDSCPTKPGPRSNGGCPWGDRDKDGVADNEDSCPDKPGAPDNNGCPWGDTDGDGLKDNVDQCPKVSGPRQNHGCPDTDRDKDTVVDRSDRCPDIPGPKSNNGCPKKLYIKVSRKKNRIFVLQKVHFDTARARIKKRSYPLLEQVYSVLQNQPNIRLRVEGHTDNVGSRRYNLRLSRNRAKAVRRFLIRKGIDPSRLVAKGYAFDRPIASNNTRAGRAKNRRVEFHIIGRGSEK